MEERTRERLQEVVDSMRLLGATWSEILRALNEVLDQAEAAHIAAE